MFVVRTQKSPPIELLTQGKHAKNGLRVGERAAPTHAGALAALTALAHLAGNRPGRTARRHLLEPQQSQTVFTRIMNTGLYRCTSFKHPSYKCTSLKTFLLISTNY